MKTPDSIIKRILVVEDEPAISEICRRVLVSEGFAVSIAPDGKIAQDMIEKEEYGLCLIDIRTPAMSGMELYQWIMEKHPKLANGVILTSGDVMGGNIQDFLKHVARPFLPKPFTPDELRTTLREALGVLKRS